jgi:hypothetical protein
MKKVLLASLALSLGLGAVTAARADDTLAGVVVGGGIGGLVGNAVSGRDGAIVGGLVGAIAGASIASGPRYEQAVYAPAPAYYPQPAYYARPAPVHYVRPAPVYYSRPVAVPVYYRGHPGWDRRHYDHDHDHGRRGWH